MHEPIFPHRRNEDGTWDSICPLCFVNSATAKCEEDLGDLEKRHICGHYSRAQRNPPAGMRAA
jgi:hypothetical protein